MPLNSSPGDLARKLAKERFGAGPQDHARAVARDDVRAHETDVLQVEGIIAVTISRVRILLGGHGFAGQR